MVGQFVAELFCDNITYTTDRNDYFWFTNATGWMHLDVLERVTIFFLFLGTMGGAVDPPRLKMKK